MCTAAGDLRYRHPHISCLWFERHVVLQADKIRMYKLSNTPGPAEDLEDDEPDLSQAFEVEQVEDEEGEDEDEDEDLRISAGGMDRKRRSKQRGEASQSSGKGSGTKKKAQISIDLLEIDDVTRPRETGYFEVKIQGNPRWRLQAQDQEEAVVRGMLPSPAAFSNAISSKDSWCWVSVTDSVCVVAYLYRPQEWRTKLLALTSVMKGWMFVKVSDAHGGLLGQSADAMANVAGMVLTKFGLAGACRQTYRWPNVRRMLQCLRSDAGTLLA
eukprot:COSAG01_NODE_5813_length_4018_cov_3.527686_7_plen_270_part_00